MGGGRLAFSARFAEERNHVLGQESTEDEARVHADMVGKAKDRELGAWRQFKVFPPRKRGGC